MLAASYRTIGMTGVRSPNQETISRFEATVSKCIHTTTLVIASASAYCATFQIGYSGQILGCCSSIVLQAGLMHSAPCHRFPSHT